MDHLFPYPKMGSSFLEILHDPLTRKLLGFDAVNAEPIPFINGVTSRLKFLLNDATQQLSFLKIGYTALEAFLQANCTGPPLDFNPEEAIFPESYRNGNLKALKDELCEHLSVDGSRPYPLTPHIELIWLAKVIMSTVALAEAGFNGRRARFRVNFWHQRLFSEESPSLRDVIYADADVLEQQLSSRLVFGGAGAEEHFVEFLVERAVVRTHYGDDALARADLARAATTRRFQFVLSGALGKRTKFQEKEISQLVVLAKSRDHEPEPYSSRKNSKAEGMEKGKSTAELESSTPFRTSTPTPISGHPTSPLASPPTQPENVLLNDDTLLERIAFKDHAASVSTDTMTQVASSDSNLPPQLAALDAANQPLLFPMDSIILLATASSITNTSPDDGLVREETLPYATRVLDGGSSNWQVYTQALLVRSRIEGYRSRTAERGLLQLQALVDQVIAETSPTAPPLTTDSTETSMTASSPTSTVASNFLPKPRPFESASVAERLTYIYQLSPPLRWELEAELAQRWTSLGGLKTALDIYERLQMYAEVALCLAATDQEAKAVELLKRLLFADDATKTVEAGKGSLTSPPPADAPRLLCILGDITSHVGYYTLSWTVSSFRYARAQRSLGRYYTKQREFTRAAESYRLALDISRLDRASWFSLGCIQLELEEWLPAVESFTRCVQLEDNDAESWSNLAVALLRLPASIAESSKIPEIEADDSIAVVDHPDDEDLSGPSTERKIDPYRHVREALRALRRAATLKRDDARIWDNYLTVAASIPPSAGTPWNEIIQAMSRVADLRGKKEGETCIDLKILKVVTEYVSGTWTYPMTLAEQEEGQTTTATSKDDDQTQGSASNGQTPTPGTTAAISQPPPAKLPYTPRSFLTLIDTQITPLTTSSPTLYALLSSIATWRHRPSQSLLLAEKSWLNTLTTLSPSEDFNDISEAQWKEVVNKTIWMIGRYKELGPLQRERTGGEVEAKWRFKARSAGRRVLGRGRTWEESGDEAWKRLKGVMEEL